jgi:hypothetical protein
VQKKISPTAQRLPIIAQVFPQNNFISGHKLFPF